MTRTDAIEWCKSKLGQAMDFDGMYSAQCTDFANFYIQYLTGQNPYSLGFGVPGAKDYWNVRVPYFDYIQNDPNDANQLPKPGDIIIYNGNMPGSGGYGHVAIVGESKQVYYEQNYGGMYVKRNTRAFNGHEIGWMSFKGFTQGGTEVMNEDTARQIAWAYLGRNGRDGRFDGLGNPSDQKGRPLTNAELMSIFHSQEARQWRDVDFPRLYEERDQLRTTVTQLREQLAQVQQALANEQSKPPKEVFKEVEKIVEKVVEVPVTVEKIVEVEPSWIIKVREAIKSFLRIK